MKIADDWSDYKILATSDGMKLENWNGVILLRPDPQVIWTGDELYSRKDINAVYRRSEKGGGAWEKRRDFPQEWTVSYRNMTFKVKPMGFKHTGLFPEQAVNWNELGRLISSARKKGRKEIKVLNLFAYTGAASVACALAGASVTHVDAAKGMVERAGENARLSGVNDGIRYIVDDCMKFVARETRRGNRYDGIIMDPPSYGRGPGGELWKIEDDIFGLLSEVKKVLSDSPVFFLVNSYTTGLQPTVIDNLLSIALGSFGGTHTAYEVGLPTSDKRGVVLPCGCSGLWVNSEGA